jgi:hypothetical protein
MSKNKTVSFRIGEGKFRDLRSIADQQGIELSSVFRDYVDTFTSHDGQVETVPEHQVRDEATQISDEFPLTVEVPKSFVRDHEQMELECEHLREQLNEYKQYASQLEDELEELEGFEDGMVRLEEVDFEAGTALQIE